MRADGIANLGMVQTGIAVKQGAAPPAIHDADSLRAALLAADAIYMPDPQLATAGIHFKQVIQQLGIEETVAARLRPLPNGYVAMAASGDARAEMRCDSGFLPL